MKFNFVFAVTVIVSLLTINTVAAQFIPDAANADDLEDQFMSSLPSDIQGAVKERNEQEEEQLAIDNLLSSETSLEKTKVLLRKINQQLNRVEEEINKQDPSFIKKDNFVLQVNDLVIWNRGKIGVTYTEKKGQYEFKKKNIV